ncbi:hypothetical protein [Thalassotalea ponticola]
MLVRMLKASSEPGDSIVLQPVLSYEEVKYLGVATAPVNLGFTYIG